MKRDRSKLTANRHMAFCIRSRVLAGVWTALWRTQNKPTCPWTLLFVHWCPRNCHGTNSCRGRIRCKTLKQSLSIDLICSRLVSSCAVHSTPVAVQCVAHHTKEHNSW